MLKKVLYLATTFILFLSLSTNGTTSAAYNNSTKNFPLQTVEESYEEELLNLTQEEIIENFKRIDLQYNVGEVFSIKDQTFIKMYAKKTGLDEVSPYASTNVDTSKTVEGITIEVNGAITQDINNVINQKFGASNLKTATTKGASKVTSVKTTVHHNAYGLIGSEGIGKVYSGDLSTTGKNSTLNGEKPYTGIVAYASTWCTVTVTHTGGTFVVTE